LPGNEVQLESALDALQAFAAMAFYWAHEHWQASASAGFQRPCGLGRHAPHLWDEEPADSFEQGGQLLARCSCHDVGPIEHRLVASGDESARRQGGSPGHVGIAHGVEDEVERRQCCALAARRVLDDPVDGVVVRAGEQMTQIKVAPPGIQQVEDGAQSGARCPHEDALSPIGEFPMCKGFVAMSLPEQNGRQVDVRLDVVGLDRDCATQPGLGRIELLSLCRDDAEVVERCREIGFERDRGLEASDGERFALLLSRRDAETEQGVDGASIDAEAATKGKAGGVRALQGQPQVAERGKPFGVIAVARQHFLQHDNSLVQVAAPPQRIGQARRGQCGVGCKIERLAIAEAGRRQIAASPIHVPERDPKGRCRRVKLDRPADQMEGIVDAISLVLDVAQHVPGDGAIGLGLQRSPIRRGGFVEPAGTMKGERGIERGLHRMGKWLRGPPHVAIRRLDPVPR
jgi:hypothetical protein